MTEPAQTNVDFLIGMAVFLLSVGFVFGLIPTVFEPFSVDGGSGALVADRGGARLAEDALGDPGNPAVLNATCTEAFFAGANPIPDGCRYGTTDVDEALAVPAGSRVNVTIEDGGGLRTLDGTTLAAGPEPPSRSDSVVVARRVVHLDGETSKLFVRVW
jgi:hypothetical protein